MANILFIMAGFPDYSFLRTARRPPKEITECIDQHVSIYLDVVGVDITLRKNRDVTDEGDDAKEEWIDLEGMAHTGATHDAKAAENLRRNRVAKGVKKVCVFCHL